MLPTTRSEEIKPGDEKPAVAKSKIENAAGRQVNIMLFEGVGTKFANCCIEPAGAVVASNESVTPDGANLSGIPRRSGIKTQ
jgi:hypothetical protein